MCTCCYIHVHVRKISGGAEPCRLRFSVFWGVRVSREAWFILQVFRMHIGRQGHIHWAGLSMSPKSGMGPSPSLSVSPSASGSRS